MRTVDILGKVAIIADLNTIDEDTAQLNRFQILAHWYCLNDCESKYRNKLFWSKTSPNIIKRCSAETIDAIKVWQTATSVASFNSNHAGNSPPGISDRLTRQETLANRLVDAGVKHLINPRTNKQTPHRVPFGWVQVASGVKRKSENVRD